MFLNKGQSAKLCHNVSKILLKQNKCKTNILARSLASKVPTPIATKAPTPGQVFAPKDEDDKEVRAQPEAYEKHDLRKQPIKKPLTNVPFAKELFLGRFDTVSCVTLILC